MSDKQFKAMHEQLEKIYSVDCDHINVDILHRYLDEQQDKITDLRMAIIDLKASLRTCANSSTHTLEQYKDL